MEKVTGNIVDVFNREIYPGEIRITSDGKIAEIVRVEEKYDCYICPPFIDSHVHIESSMLTPVEFSNLIVSKGTAAIVNDPHEIANVLGVEGIRFMVQQAADVPVKMFFGIPSCVPATPFDSAGAEISAAEVEALAKSGHFVALSEMMNVPGVLSGDPEVKQKINIARKYGLLIDGHAPALSGDDLKKYVDAGISTDHECSDLKEALEKIAVGMKIMIREGSAAKNFDALHDLIGICPEQLMFCTDDAHPDDIQENGHVDKMIRRAVLNGYNVYDVLKIASWNPIKHYHLPVGMLRKGDPADFVVVGNLKTFPVLATYIQGVKRYDLHSPAESPSSFVNAENVNRFSHDRIREDSLKKQITDPIPLIQVYDGKLLTGRGVYQPVQKCENFESDVANDVLKIVYLNRYRNLPPQIAFVQGIGLQEGAYATSIAHDSHNILAVGCNDKDLTDCINRIITLQGGLVVKNSRGICDLPLPIGGIMSDKNYTEVITAYRKLNDELKFSGVRLKSPFMTLAFMSLIVIPELKIGEKGLFDFTKFDFVPGC